MVLATNIVRANEGHNRIIISWVTYDEFSSRFDTNPSDTVSSSDFLHYEIYRSTNPLATLNPGELIDVVGRREVKRYADNTAEENTDYYYTVVWVNKDETKEQWEWRGPYRWARPKHVLNLKADYDSFLGGKDIIISWDRPTTESDSITPLINYQSLAGYRVFWSILGVDEQRPEANWSYDVYEGYQDGYRDRDGSGRSDGYGEGLDVVYYENFVDVPLSSLNSDFQGIGASIAFPKYKFPSVQLGKKYVFNVKAYDSTTEIIDVGDEALQSCIEILFDADRYEAGEGETILVTVDLFNCGIDTESVYVEHRLTVRDYGYAENVSISELHDSASGSDSPLSVGSNYFTIPINIADTAYNDYYGGSAYGYTDIGEYELCVDVFEDSTKTNLITSACVNVMADTE